MIDNIATIKLSVEHGQLRLVKSVDATTQSVNTFQISFTFLSNEWNDMVKIATFFRKDMEPMSIIVDSDNSCLVPWEILDVPSTWHGDIIYDVGIIGSGADNSRLVTNKVRLKIQPSSYADGQGSQLPTPNIYEQLSARIDALNDYSKEEILQFVAEYIGAGAQVNVQSDWNQNDETANDYIKNKPQIATDDDIIDFLAELGEITPVAALDGSIYTDNQNRIVLI